MEQDNRRLKTCDRMFILIVCLMIMVRILSFSVLAYTARDTKADIEAVAIVYEANPIAKILLLLNHSGVLIFNIGLPAVVIATYLYFRSKVKSKKVPSEALFYYLNVAVFSLILNILNDASVFIVKVYL